MVCCGFGLDFFFFLGGGGGVEALNLAMTAFSKLHYSSLFSNFKINENMPHFNADKKKKSRKICL